MHIRLDSAMTLGSIKIYLRAITGFRLDFRAILNEESLNYYNLIPAMAVVNSFG
jgi:hypothetical protein